MLGKRLTKAFVSVCSLLWCVAAQATDNKITNSSIATLSDNLKEPVGDQKVSAPVLSMLFGVYRFGFKSELIDGSEYDAEDVILIVPVDSLSFYLDLKIEGSNAHKCHFIGVLTYTRRGDFLHLDSEGQCKLRMRADKKSLKFLDASIEKGCSIHCGTRVSLDGYEMPRSRKQAIKDVEEIRKSVEYMSTLLDYQQSFVGVKHE